MEEPNQSALFSKVINFNELEGEFHLDLDFGAQKDPYRSKDKEDLSEFKDMMIEEDDDTDSESEDVYKEAEKRTEHMMLSSPEYMSFDDLAAKMIDVPCEIPGAVKISILNEGDGPLVPTDAVVTMHYSAYFEKHTVPFDSTLNIKWTDGNPSQYRLGRHQILPGLEYALTAVRGPTAHILALLQPEVTWGPHGNPPRIPPKPVLFVIVLYSVMEGNAHDMFDFLPPEEQSKFATTARTVKSLREKAKHLFQKKQYESAIKSYKSAQNVISLSLPETDEESQALRQLKVEVLINMAVCYYKRLMPNRVLDMCKCIDRIIDLDTHCKALFYKGRAYEMLGKLDLALENYKKALKLEPNNKEIGALLSELDAKIQKSKEVEADMWKKVFHTKAEKKETFKVDEEFQTSVRELCEDLATRTEYTKVELQKGLGTEEAACVRYEATRVNLIVEENGDGTQRRLSVIKRLL